MGSRVPLMFLPISLKGMKDLVGLGCLHFNTAGFNMDVKNFFDKWLIDLTYDQRSDGEVPGVVPHNNYLGPNDSEGLEGNLDGLDEDAATIIPWNSFLIYGDKETLRQYMKKWIGFMSKNSIITFFKREITGGTGCFFPR